MILAQVETLREASQSFRDYSDSQSALALAVVVVLGLIVVALVLFSILSSRTRRSHGRVFRAFAEASGLTAPETKLLLSVAERVQPENLVAIFVKRTLFESALLDLGVDPAQAGALRKKVYGP